MSSVLSPSRKKIKSWLIERMFTYTGSSYQRERFPRAKFELIAQALDMARVGSVLDVGCNEGYVTAEFAKLGKFAVGIDVGPHFLHQVLNGLDEVYNRQSAAFGVFPLSEENVDAIATFDVVMLLSVHHQLTSRFGDAYTRRLVARLSGKARQAFVIEFAGTAQKYGLEEAPFEDNDEASIRAYAERWLADLGVEGAIEYLGRNREHSGLAEREPYRYLFIMRKAAR